MGAVFLFKKKPTEAGAEVGRGGGGWFSFWIFFLQDKNKNKHMHLLGVTKCDGSFFFLFFFLFSPAVCQINKHKKIPSFFPTGGKKEPGGLFFPPQPHVDLFQAPPR